MIELLQSLLFFQLAALAGIGGIFWRVGKLTSDVGALTRRVTNLERKADGVA